jgi:hypothetical protein
VKTCSAYGTTSRVEVTTVAPDEVVTSGCEVTTSGQKLTAFRLDWTDFPPIFGNYSRENIQRSSQMIEIIRPYRGRITLSVQSAGIVIGLLCQRDKAGTVNPG